MFLFFDKLKSLTAPKKPSTPYISKEELAERQARATYQKMAEYIDRLPAAEIQIGGVKRKKLKLDELPEIKFTNITKRNADKIRDYTVIHVETTNLKSSGNILEISAVRFVDREPTMYMSTLIKPNSKIPESATAINGITNDLVADSPRIYEVVDSFKDFIGSSAIVGYNLYFDLKVLYPNNFSFSSTRYYDAMELAKKVLKQPKDLDDVEFDVFDYKLSSVCKRYGLLFSREHRSLGFCISAGESFALLLDYYS